MSCGNQLAMSDIDTYDSEDDLNTDSAQLLRELEVSILKRLLSQAQSSAKPGASKFKPTQGVPVRAPEPSPALPVDPSSAPDELKLDVEEDEREEEENDADGAGTGDRISRVGGGLTPQQAAQLAWRPEAELPTRIVPGTARAAAPLVAEKERGLAKQLKVAPRDGRKPRPAASGVKVKGSGGVSGSTGKWYELPAVAITPEVKRDLRLLRLRGALDPKHHYKRFDETKFPTNFQMGTVEDDPLDFYSGRMAQRQRKDTLTEQLLVDPAVSAARKRRYNKLQAEATRYQKVKKRKTSMPREKRKPPRPKH